MSELQVLDKSGDTRLQWDRKNQAEVDAARERFDSFKRLGYTAYRVNRRGDQGELIDNFDPDAERLMMMPQMVGG